MKKAFRSKWQHLGTEAANPASRGIDARPTAAVVDTMVADQRSVMTAVRRERARIARAADAVATALRNGGRIIFVGAGTSGRLAVLEAAELPPTFGLPPARAIAVMAGGETAVARAREGVEDDARAGARAIRRLRVQARDVMIGISASGVTPFVQSAVEVARAAGAPVIAITCNGGSPLARAARIAIVLRTGPEIVAGSTRLKAGTATKIALNVITTAAMIRIGKTYGNLMIDVQLNSRKLHDRARRIVTELTGVRGAAAGALLREAGGHVKTAVIMRRLGVGRAEADARLRAAGDSLRAALKSTPGVDFSPIGPKAAKASGNRLPESMSVT